MQIVIAEHKLCPIFSNAAHNTGEHLLSAKPAISAVCKTDRLYHPINRV